ETAFFEPDYSWYVEDTRPGKGSRESRGASNSSRAEEKLKKQKKPIQRFHNNNDKKQTTGVFVLYRSFLPCPPKRQNT
ncbi:hypothetical protein PanWU01x14_099030, partial [Parasponia andersonii]